MPVLFLRAHFLNCGLQIMEKFWIGKHVKMFHLYGQFLNDFPYLFFFSGQHSLCITGCLRVSPAFLFQELNTLLIVLACNQLVNGAVGK